MRQRFHFLYPLYLPLRTGGVPVHRNLILKDYFHISHKILCWRASPDACLCCASPDACLYYFIILLFLKKLQRIIINPHLTLSAVPDIGLHHFVFCPHFGCEVIGAQVIPFAWFIFLLQG